MRIPCADSGGRLFIVTASTVERTIGKRRGRCQRTLSGLAGSLIQSVKPTTIAAYFCSEQVVLAHSCGRYSP